ncbi:putative fad dependent oxidoreductase protein [Ilyonectria robusta]
MSSRIITDPRVSYYQGNSLPITKDGQLKFGFRGRKGTPTLSSSAQEAPCEEPTRARPDQFTSVWKWRVAKPDQANNGLSEGENGPREMSRLEMALRGLQ